MDLEKKILSDITVHMKYARFLEDKNRRENWDELVTRNKQTKAGYLSQRTVMDLTALSSMHSLIGVM